MVDDSDPKWRRLDETARRLDCPGLAVRRLPGLGQTLASGDLWAAAARAGVDAAGVGALGNAQGATYSLRLARDRLLVVSEAPSPLAAGWSDDCYAVTDVTGGFDVFEISGAHAADVVARATNVPITGAGPSAAIVFAGILGYLYRHGDGLRLHVERGYSAFIWQWFETLVTTAGWNED